MTTVAWTILLRYAESEPRIDLQPRDRTLCNALITDHNCIDLTFVFDALALIDLVHSLPLPSVYRSKGNQSRILYHAQCGRKVFPLPSATFRRLSPLTSFEFDLNTRQHFGWSDLPFPRRARDLPPWPTLLPKSCLGLRAFKVAW